MKSLLLFSAISLIYAKDYDLLNLLTKKTSLDWIRATSTNSTNPYCKICCIAIEKQTVTKKCGSHTMCKYEEGYVGPACKGFISVRFSGSEQSAIVDIHNTLRNSVASGAVSDGNPGPQPSAANMRALEWNDTLAAIAERWASQCVYSRDICRDLDTIPVGQNIARGKKGNNNDLSLIYTWFDKVKHFNSSHVHNHSGLTSEEFDTSFYTQFVWADTYMIGCARVIFQILKRSKVHYQEHLICNYGPTGNIPNLPVYKVGTPCSSCQEGTACTTEYSALCSSESRDDLYEYLESYGNHAKLFKQLNVLLALACLRFVMNIN